MDTHSRLREKWVDSATRVEAQANTCLEVIIESRNGGHGGGQLAVNRGLYGPFTV